MWRYREFLPVEGTSRVPKLRVGWSPFYKATALRRFSALRLFIMDDGINPTASLKVKCFRNGCCKSGGSGKKYYRLFIDWQCGELLPEMQQLPE